MQHVRQDTAISGGFKLMHDSDIPPPSPWAAFAHTDGRIVTGANPASAQATAEAVVQAFEKL